MKYLAILIICIAAIGCRHAARESANVSSKDTIVVVQRDTIVVIQQTPAQKDTSPIIVSKKVKEEKAPSLPVAEKKSSDTTFYYYVNKKVSAKVTPWAEGERWVLLYDLYGKETYRHQDVRKSYTVFANLHFHTNGAVSKMVITNNPGASMYWSETTITFSTINEPEQKTKERKPYPESPTIEQPWEYWDKKTGQWRKQEVQE